MPEAGRLAAPIASSLNPDRIVNRIADVVYIPAGGVVATVLVCVAAVVALASRRPRAEITCWIAAYVLGNLLELVGKWTITRPALHTTPEYGSLHVWKFDTSFPSGHTMRACILAAFVVWVAPRLRAPVTIWASAVVVLLVVAGTHTPTDVIGGLLAAAALVLLCGETVARLGTRGVAV
jgi:membrane-associated phospholipid phosphatase